MKIAQLIAELTKEGYEIFFREIPGNKTELRVVKDRKYNQAIEITNDMMEDIDEFNFSRIIINAKKEILKLIK
jgi:hypothetical protein